MAPPVACVGAFGMGRVSPSGQWVKCPMNTRTKDPTRFPPPPPPQVQPRLRYALTLTPLQRECSVSLPSPLICGKRPCELGVGTGLDQQGRGSAHPRHRPALLGTKSKCSTCLWGRGRQAHTQGGNRGGTLPPGSVFRAPRE